MTEENEIIEDESKISRRKMLGRTAVAGGIVWATPMVLSSPAGAVEAVESPGGGEEPCPEGSNVKLLLVKYDVGADSFSAINHTNTNECLLILHPELLDDPDLATQSETACFIAYAAQQGDGFSADVTYEGEDTSSATRVVITLPSDCDIDENFEAAAKQGQDPGCDDGADAVDGDTITFDQSEGEKNAISNVAVAIRCCIPDNVCSLVTS